MDLTVLETALNTGWILLGAALVFFMQAGFAMVETGFTRAKNAGNIIMKNLMDFSLGTPIFWLIGFGLMFGGSGKLVGGLDLFFQLRGSELPAAPASLDALRGKVAVVFGGSYGIGHDIVAQLYAAGTRVHAFARSTTGTDVGSRESVAEALQGVAKASDAIPTIRQQ